MLQRLLNEMREGGTLEIRTLAARLDTSPEVVVAMLEHLQRLGLADRYQDCGGGCGGCMLQDTCSVRPSIRLWQAEEK